MAPPKGPHPGWTPILIAVFLLVLTVVLIFTGQVPPPLLWTALLPTLALVTVGILLLRSGK